MVDHLELLDLQRAIVSIFVFKIIVILCAGFMAITFCQSAIDKITNYTGNEAYFKSQFDKSPLKNLAGLLLPVLILLEASSGLLCAFGIIWRMTTRNGDSTFVAIGLFVSAVTLLCLLFGQRVAKDYAGASSLTGYFIIAILGLLALAAAF